MSDNSVTEKPFGIGLSQRIFLIILVGGGWAFADQYHKYYMLEIYNIAEKGVVEWLPYMNLVLVWNKGISYGLFQQSGNGPLILGIVSMVIALILVIVCLRSKDRITIIIYSCFIGTALGNGYDRIFREGVVDVFQPVYGDYGWYVFNIADVGMGVGVALLLVDMLFLSHDDAKED